MTRWLYLFATASSMLLYLWFVITAGAGVNVGDEGYWLLQQRAAAESFPAIPGSLTPLTDVVGGCWLTVTQRLGLAGARCGWMLVNVAGALLAFTTLTRWFPAPRVALAILMSTPMICHQQFMVLEYTNVPWFFLLAFAVAFVRSQASDTPAPAATRWAIAAGAGLACAVLARAPLVTAFALPACAGLMGRGGSDGRRSLVACYSSAVVVLAGGIAFLWSTGSLSAAIEMIRATRELGNDDASRSFYSNWRLMSVYAQNLIVGIEQLAVILLWLGCYLASRVFIERQWGPRWLWVANLSLVLACCAGVAGALAAKGVFNPRYLPGLPFVAVICCAGACLAHAFGPESAANRSLRQLYLLAAAIPVFVMLGSNLGFYRMLSASWLTIPLAIVSIPSAGRGLDECLGRVFPRAQPALIDASQIFLRSVGAYFFLYAITYGLVHGFASGSPRLMTASMPDPMLRFIRETPKAAEEIVAALAALHDRVQPGDTVLAYPHLEMLNFLTKTRSPLAHMFVHSSERTIQAALNQTAPTCIIYRDNSGDPLWSLSETRRQVVDRFLASRGYQRVWQSASYAIFAIPYGEESGR